MPNAKRKPRSACYVGDHSTTTSVNVPDSCRSHKNATAAKRITYGRSTTNLQKPLDAWPGHGADDEDPDDFEDDGTEDLPGALEPLHSRRSRK